MRGAITGGLIVALVCTIFASMGYRGREQVVGIDLGTTFSVVAVKFSNGTVKIIPDYITKKPLTPSVVHYFENGTVIAGARAIAYRDTHPGDTIYNSKRFIGRRLEDVLNETANHRYNVVSMSDAQAGFELTDRRVVSPIDVGREVLLHLHKSIESFMGYPMTTAIICIPAKFGKEEAEGTKQAFERAGFKVQRIMDEPTAAAVAYNLHKTISPRNVLVYDLGGGTLDASLLWMNGNAVTVVGTSGDDHLGGSDFDHVMQKILAAELPKCSDAHLGLLAEETKIKLSDTTSTTVECKGDTTTVTRERFYLETDHLFRRALQPLDELLEVAMMEKKHVDDVVLVGGATRMPRIREWLREYFLETTPIHMDIDPDTTVAYGAANIW